MEFSYELTSFTGSAFIGAAAARVADCSAAVRAGGDGVYVIRPGLSADRRTARAYCQRASPEEPAEEAAAAAGWTVIQRRVDGRESFSRGWDDYAAGFGDPADGDYWLGNEYIHRLTSLRAPFRLRVDMWDVQVPRFIYLFYLL